MKGEGEEEMQGLYQQLVETQLVWDEKLSSVFRSSAKCFQNYTSHLPILQDCNEEPERTSLTPDANRTQRNGFALAQSRHAKKAAHRADDVEFAFEIGSGLLTDIRLRDLQSTLPDSQSSNYRVRLESEIKPLTKQRSSARGASDISITEHAKLENTTEDLTAKHELEISQATNHVAWAHWKWL